ncbi:MAG: leucine-rich repeat protein [Clostridia bacterium]|nr:leucine-rich repeat protein [Clostridia bacterium]
MSNDAAIPMECWQGMFTGLILSRGADYSCKGAVTNLKQDAAHLEADVAGSKTYHVRIELKDNAIEHMHCSCPYAADGERNCKHMAALLFTAFSPNKAKEFKPKETWTSSPSHANCTQVTIRVEEEETIAQRYCAIPEVKVGDYVAFLLNERETVGVVESIQQMPRPIEFYGYGRKNHVLRITEKPEHVGLLTIQIRPPAPFVRLTIAAKASFKRIRMKRSCIESHNIKVGDILLLDDKEREQAVVLSIDDNATDDLPIGNFIAVRENDEFAALLKNKVSFHSQNDSLKGAQFILHRWTSETFEARIPYGVDRVESFAFEENWDVKRVVISGNYIRLDPFAFGHNESIEEIVFEADDVSFVPSSFDGCMNLRKLSLPYTYYDMGNELAQRFPQVTIAYQLNENVLAGDIVYSSDKTKLVCCTNKELVFFHCPDSVREILPEAFSGCRLLKRFMLTPFVTKCGMGCLAGCVNLEEVAMSYDKKIAFTLMFGEAYCPDAEPVTLMRNDGVEVTFYLPRACKLTKLPTMDESLRVMAPEALSAENAYAVAEYCEKQHNMKKTVEWYMSAYRSGLEKAHEKLIVLLQSEAYHQYFAINTFDELTRANDLTPFLHAFALTDAGKRWPVMLPDQRMASFKEKHILHDFLKDVANTEILHDELLSTLLKRMYPQLIRKASLDTKALFYRCARKLQESSRKPSWYDGLLSTLLASPLYQRAFLFDRLQLRYDHRNERHERLIASLTDAALREDVAKAYEASIHPQQSNVELYKHFIQKAKDSGDEVYQWCALLSVWTYAESAWRSKNTDVLKNVLQAAMDACTDGLSGMGQIVLNYRQNLKRNIPRSFYRMLAERLHMQGKLFFNDYETLLGDYRSNQIDFFYRYADWLEQKEQNPILWQHLQASWVYVPGIALKDEEGKSFKDTLARPYETFIPLKTGKDLILFSNPHEAVCYMMQNELPVVDYYFCMPYSYILTIMDQMNLNDALLMPYCFNMKITKRELEQMWT